MTDRIVGPGDLVANKAGRVGVIVARHRAGDAGGCRWWILFGFDLVDTTTMAGCSIILRAE